MYKVYKLFNDSSDKVYYGITKLELNLCLCLLRSYKYRYDLDNTKPQYKYFDILNDEQARCKLVRVFETRQEAKTFILEYADENKITPKQNISNKTANIKEYNKIKYQETKDKFKTYYQKNKETIRQKQKERYNLYKEKLKAIKEI